MKETDEIIESGTEKSQADSLGGEVAATATEIGDEILQAENDVDNALIASGEDEQSATSEIAVDESAEPDQASAKKPDSKAMRIFKAVLPFALKSLVIIFAVVGIGVFAVGGDFMASAPFLYFTIQSNLWIALMCAVFIVLDALVLSGKLKSIPNFCYALKFMATTAITLTFLVFLFMLTPTMVMAGQGAYLGSLNNVCVHNLVPIIALVDFFLFDYKYKTKAASFLLSAILPIYYLIFAYCCAAGGVSFGGSKYPYFFMDYEANGWFSIGGGKFGVVYWIVLLTLVVLAYSWFFLWLQKKHLKRVESRLSLSK